MRVKSVQKLVENAKTSHPTEVEEEHLDAPRALLPKEFVGLSTAKAKEKAKAHAMQVRITCEDGKYFIGSADLNSNRINLEIVRGKVVNAAIG